MSQSKSTTNIPILRRPLSPEVLDNMPLCPDDNVGSDLQPIYVKGKVITPSNGTAGTDLRPLKIVNGVLQPITADLAPALAPSFTRKTGSTTADVPTSPTPAASDPDTMIATKVYVDDSTSGCSRVTIEPKTTTGDVIGVFTLNGTIYNICNGVDSSGRIEGICVPLLTPMWFDHTLSSDSWVQTVDDDTLTYDKLYARATAAYTMIYDHLAADYTAGTTKTASYTLTNGTTLTFDYKEATDGHKICTSDKLTKLNQIYTDQSIGEAWFFVIDTTNKKFGLPRTKYGFHGKNDYIHNPQSDASRKMLLHFYTGVGPTTDDKMDKVKAGVGDFTTTATYGHIPSFKSGSGQIEDSGHAVVNAAAPADTDLVTVSYMNTTTFNKIYPVGSVYLSVSATIPSGFLGTWEKMSSTPITGVTVFKRTA